MDKVILKETSSAFLFFYHYLILLAISFGLLLWFKALAFAPIILIMTLIRYAQSMKYELTETAIHFSANLFDKESMLVNLADVKGFYIVDRQPWSFFSLGTVLVITNMDADSHPCIKCIKDPYRLAKTINRYALKCGAHIEPDLALRVI